MATYKDTFQNTKPTIKDVVVIPNHHNDNREKVVKSKDITVTEELRIIFPESVSFTNFWELLNVVESHGYTRAAMSVIGRSTIGTEWGIVPNPEVGRDADSTERKELLDFYYFKDRTWTNVKDYHDILYKLNIGAMYLRFFGFCAYQIVRDKNTGRPLGFDFLHGYTIPNVDSKGEFKPGSAFHQYPLPTLKSKVEYADQNDIIYIMNPDWATSKRGGSDMSSLSDFTLPIDIWLQTVAREYLKNRERPEAMFVLSNDASDEAFNSFVEELKNKYAGAQNIGKNPVAVRGDLEVVEFEKFADGLPYQDAREDTRHELLAVAGVNESKLGVPTVAANYKESRKEFYETTMKPLLKQIASAFNLQINVREFGIYDWLFKFRSPDFMDSIQKATISMRMHGMGAITPNEIREDWGLLPREDELGDMFSDQLELEQQANPQGSPPEGREEAEDRPHETGEPTLDDQDPPRGDDKTLAIEELKQMSRFVKQRVRKGGQLRDLGSDVIGAEELALINQSIHETVKTVEDVTSLFSDLINLYEEYYK